MNKITIPEHDINQLFDNLVNIIKVGDCADSTMDECRFLNSLFAALPAEAIEEFMRFLADSKKPSKACDEIMPLFIRLINLVTYCDKILELRDLPISADMKIIKKRASLTEELDNLEEPFGKNLMGYAFGSATKQEAPKQTSQPTSQPISKKDDNSPNTGSGLLLMNGSAVIFPCADIYKTSLFYEQKLGFSAVMLDDESMPHIRITRDNIIINLVQCGNKVANECLPLRKVYGIPYDAYIYVAEPLLLLNELKAKDIKIIKELESSEKTVNSGINREFVFEDCDGRHICVSQCDNIDKILGFV